MDIFNIPRRMMQQAEQETAEALLRAASFRAIVEHEASQRHQFYANLSASDRLMFAACRIHCMEFRDDTRT